MFPFYSSFLKAWHQDTGIWFALQVLSVSLSRRNPSPLSFSLACNILLFSNASFVKSPTSSKELRGILKKSLEFRCDYVGADGNGEFLEWYKDEIPVNSEKPGHYVVKSNATESRLIIKIFGELFVRVSLFLTRSSLAVLVSADADVKKWHVKSAKTGFDLRDACAFEQIPRRNDLLVAVLRLRWSSLI